MNIAILILLIGNFILTGFCAIQIMRSAVVTWQKMDGNTTEALEMIFNMDKVKEKAAENRDNGVTLEEVLE